jgi:hypothetical protein
LNGEDFKPIETSAEAGNLVAQMILGYVYSVGSVGLEKDPVQSVQWFKKAALQGNAWAKAMLASAYLEGTGIPQSFAEGYQWAKQSAEQGDPIGEYWLATCLATGSGVPKDTEEAIRILKKLAEQGVPRAQLTLATLHNHLENWGPHRYMAYVWANVAVALGDNEGRDLRDNLASEIPVGELEAAQELSQGLFESSRAARESLEIAVE